MTTLTSARPRLAPRLRTLCAALAAAGTLLLTPCAHAERIAWQGSRFEYVADHKDLRDVLRDFGASQQVMTWISPQVTGNVTGRFSSSPQQFLDKMGASFGILWYYNGGVLRIYGANEARSATLGLRHASTDDLRKALARLQVEDPRFPVRYDNISRTAVVSGPPRLVDLVSDVARLIDQAPVSGSAVVVQRFPLRYASASDRTITINGRSVTVRGVAALLRGLYGQGAAGAGAGGAANEAAPARRDVYRVPSMRETQDDGIAGVARVAGTRAPPLPTMPGFGAAPSAAGANAPRGIDDDPVRAGTRPPDERAGAGAAAQAGPSIEADARSNSILVRDRAENMAAYGPLIESLDMRPGVLEIDATIIEISDNALHEIGVDWHLQSNRNGRSAQGSEQGALNAIWSGGRSLPKGGLSTVVGGAGRFLLDRISALQQTDQARITANPKVETLDNVEALMDSKQTFYVQVAGHQSADLYSVSAGVSLRVLPSIVTAADGTQQIRMDVHIEDGKLTSQQVGQLPVVSNSTIDTQALINEGESLLIAGYSVNREENMEAEVPGLSKLPVIGDMFRYRKKQGQHFQRLFLLTPRVLSAAVGGAAGGKGATSGSAGSGSTGAGDAIAVPLPSLKAADATPEPRRARSRCRLKREVATGLAL